MIVFDAGVLIAFLDGRDAHHRAAVDFIDEHEEFEFALNAITLTECLVHPVIAGDPLATVRAIDRLAFVEIDIPASDALGMARVRGETRLKLGDATVLFSAERHRASALVTTDRALARAAEERGVEAHLI